jgi:hypothetical protein
MSDTFLKLLALPFALRLRYLRNDFRRWRKEFWQRDLDGYWCCSGFDGYGQVGCGCQGMSRREELIYRYLPWLAR